MTTLVMNLVTNLRTEINLLKINIMTELIIIKTEDSQELKKFLTERHINYEIYQEPKQDWENKEKLAFQEWEKLSDEELIAEWEKLPDNGWENN